jgi:hypothetical protein
LRFRPALLELERRDQPAVTGLSVLTTSVSSALTTNALPSNTGAFIATPAFTANLQTADPSLTPLSTDAIQLGALTDVVPLNTALTAAASAAGIDSFRFGTSPAATGDSSSARDLLLILAPLRVASLPGSTGGLLPPITIPLGTVPQVSFPPGQSGFGTPPPLSAATPASPPNPFSPVTSDPDIDGELGASSTNTPEQFVVANVSTTPFVLIPQTAAISGGGGGASVGTNLELVLAPVGAGIAGAARPSVTSDTSGIPAGVAVAETVQALDEPPVIKSGDSDAIPAPDITVVEESPIARSRFAEIMTGLVAAAYGLWHWRQRTKEGSIDSAELTAHGPVRL